VSQSTQAIGPGGEAARVDTIEIISVDGRQQSRPGDNHRLVCLLQRCHGGSEVGILVAGSRLNFLEGRQRRWQAEVVDYGEILIEAGEKKDRELQAGLVHLQLRFLQVSLLLVVLDLGL